MNALSFKCSAHGEQPLGHVSVGKIHSVPVRVALACGCCFLWQKDSSWIQQTGTNGLQELARDNFTAKGQEW